MTTIITTSTQNQYGIPKKSVTLNSGDTPIKLRDLAEFFSVAHDFMGFNPERQVQVHVDTNVQDGEPFPLTLAVQS